MELRKNAMQVPPIFATALAIDPHERFVLRPGDEVVAGDVVPVPPAGLDTLGTGKQIKRSFIVRHRADFLEPLWTIEQPERAFAKIDLRLLCAQLGGGDGALGTVLGPRDKPVYGAGSKPRAQALDQVLPLAQRLALLEQQPEIAAGKRYHVVGL